MINFKREFPLTKFHIESDFRDHQVWIISNPNRKETFFNNVLIVVNFNGNSDAFTWIIHDVAKTLMSLDMVHIPTEGSISYINGHFEAHLATSILEEFTIFICDPENFFQHHEDSGLLATFDMNKLKTLPVPDGYIQHATAAPAEEALQLASNL